MSFDYFCYLSAIDWMPHTWPNPKVIEAPAAWSTPTRGRRGRPRPRPRPRPTRRSRRPTAPRPASPAATPGSRSSPALYSTVRHIGVTLKADLDDDAPSIDSWISEYPGADWCERETWEMYGFDFVGHPNLIHLYLPGEFEGFPMRKDFPLLAREVKPWPGLVDVEQFPATYKGDD